MSLLLPNSPHFLVRPGDGGNLSRSLWKKKTGKRLTGLAKELEKTK